MNQNKQDLKNLSNEKQQHLNKISELEKEISKKQIEMQNVKQQHDQMHEKVRVDEKNLYLLEEQRKELDKSVF